ncbi:MAG: hypothetical protein ACK4SO_06555, partial [Candidatus Kapaibacteriota bacterium]
MEKIYLKNNRIIRIESGHLWIYRKELASIPDSDGGTIVEVFTADGKSLGLAFYNPHSTIAIRLLKIFAGTDVIKVFKQR